MIMVDELLQIYEDHTVTPTTLTDDIFQLIKIDDMDDMEMS
jgi:hypothetical protein